MPCARHNIPHSIVSGRENSSLANEVQQWDPGHGPDSVLYIQKKKVVGRGREMKDANFPNLRRGIDIQIQEAQITPPNMNLKRPTLKHIIIFQNYKERMLKAEGKNESLCTRELLLDDQQISQQEPSG
jgi:hypothetical protein